jgi:hypothetical protein
MNQSTPVLNPTPGLPPEFHDQLARRHGPDAAEEAVAVAAALRVAIAMAPELGWSSERTFREAEAWARRVSPHAIAAG